MGVLIMKTKITLISAATLMSIVPLFALNNTAQAADNSVKKTVMHTAIAYNKDGNRTSQKYNAYSTVTVDSKPIAINDDQYYKILGKDQYLKITNIDGVTRKITHNTYIYKSSSARTSYRGRWKLYRSETITTYGSSYKFKNGKSYFRVGGPRKQYIKSYNLGPVVNSDVESTSAVATVVRRAHVWTEIGPNKFENKLSDLKVGTKVLVDRLEYNRLSENSPQDEDTGMNFRYYHIKGTKNWISEEDVKVNKKVPFHNYNKEHYTYITFPKDTDVYNADGTIQDHNGQKISKQKGQLKVDKLVYIWVPSENKAELFYHLVGTSFYASTTPTAHWSTINVGHDAYVKASDVKFVYGVKLTPSNTAAEAQAAAQKNKLN